MGGRHRFGSYWRLRLRWRDRQRDFPWLLLLSLFLHSNNNELGEYNFATTSTHQLSAVVNLGQSCDTFPATASHSSTRRSRRRRTKLIDNAMKLCDTSVCLWVMTTTTRMLMMILEWFRLLLLLMSYHILWRLKRRQEKVKESRAMHVHKS